MTIVQQELIRIKDQNGGVLRPETVVEKARDIKSPLHPRFEWDNTKAAHEYRLWQARKLIAVHVEVIGSSRKESRVYVALSSDKPDGGGYRTLVDVLNDKEMRATLLQDAYDDMKRFEQKYSRLKELVTVFAAFRKVHSK